MMILTAVVPNVVLFHEGPFVDTSGDDSSDDEFNSKACAAPTTSAAFTSVNMLLPYLGGVVANDAKPIIR